MSEENLPAVPVSAPHRRRPRYPGKNPRRFEDKYKEHARDEETIAKVIAAGKTPAGTHRPIMVREILQVLAPVPGAVAVDATLGYGGHAEALLAAIAPGGHLLGLDQDPIQLPKTEARLRSLGFDETVFSAHRSNFAGLPQVLAKQKISGVDLILADLGVSSMQLDEPARGFSVKLPGPLDMRMNPQRGQSASAWLEKVNPAELAAVLADFADEPRAVQLAPLLAGKSFATTTALTAAIRAALPQLTPAEMSLTVRRVFQAVRIAVNDEFGALEMFLRNLSGCLKPGGRVAVLTFHSGEDRRVKKAFAAGQREGLYSAIAEEVQRPSAEEQRDNPRSSPAKLRWAIRAD